MDHLDKIAVWPGWETVRLIGRGSFGAVYEIERKMLGSVEKAALKIISIPQSRNEIEDLLAEGYDEASVTERYKTYMEGILREYALMAKVKGCANIVYCDDVRSTRHADGIGWDIFIKMELLTPMMKALPFSPEEEQVIRAGRELCNALRFCEAENILHRDIKPQNIFVARDGTCKLGDFGVAKTAERTSGGTKTGTYKYMAPEVFNNQPYGPRADIYSLGLVLYWLLNDRRTPFLPLPPAVPSATDEEEAKARRFRGETIPAPAYGSPALKRIVLKACAYDPKDRYASAEEMMRDLESAAYGLHSPGAQQETDDEATVSDATVRANPSYRFKNPSADPADEESTLGVNPYRVPAGRSAGPLKWEEEEETQGVNPKAQTPGPAPAPQQKPTPAPQSKPTPAPQSKPTPASQFKPTPAPQPGPTPASQSKPTPASQSKSAPTAGGDKPKRGKSKLPLILGAVGVLVLILVIVLLPKGGSSKTPAPAVQSAPSAAPVTVRPETSAPAASESAQTEAEPASTPAPADTPAPVATPSAEEYTAKGFQMTKDGLYWKLEGKTLIISGAGKMADYSQYSQPWSKVMGQYDRIEIENGVNSVGAWAFSDDNSLVAVSLPESLTEIGEDAFCNCFHLEEISLPAGLRSIGDQAFMGCSNLKSAPMQDGLVSIGKQAFFSCSALTEITIPEGVISLSESAFYNCTSLSRISLPGSLKAIGPSAFGRCDAIAEIYYAKSQADLESITVESGNEALTGAALHCQG